MRAHPFLPSLASLAAALVVASPAAAQQALPPSDADALAAQMRIIATQPTNVDALAQAGELSARLGDLSGAASLFARADKADPRNGRVKAGMAEVLLRAERPGEALQYYNQAEGYGYPVARFAAERGLAYDLVGQQGRAQRDYRIALAADGANAEVTRRYALSLGISGQGEAALGLLDPLTRRNDRAAWRARAFVLAMGGDVAAANTIATTMMAPGQAQGLAPFFSRLASLDPVDRAFAVQFGEVRATPQRLADARLAPALPPLAPEIVPVARVAVAAASTTAARPGRGPDRRRSRDPVAVAVARPAARAAAAPVSTAQVAAVAAPPRPASSTQVAAATPPRHAAQPSRIAIYDPGSVLRHYLPRSAIEAPSQPRSTEPVRLSAVADAPAVSGLSRAGMSPLPGAAPAGLPSPAIVASAVPAARPASPPLVLPAPQALASPVPQPLTLPAAPPPPLQPVALPSPQASAAPFAGPGAAPPQARMEAPSSPASAPQAVASDTVAASRPSDVAPTAVQPVAAPIVPAVSDAILARIVDALTIPGRELAAAGARAPSEAAAPAEPPVARAGSGTGSIVASEHRSAHARSATDATPPAVRDLAAATPDDTPASTRRSRHRSRTAADEAVAVPVPADDTVPARRGRRGAHAADDAQSGLPPAAKETPVKETSAEETPASRRAAARQASADRKAAVDRKAAIAARAQEAKEEAEAKRAARSEPKRYWVQVAGGANEGDLPKAWASAKGKADALGTHKAWTTPLRATNRVLAGPFKTDDEARAFVNTLKKQGLPAFQFTSEAGQKITRLDAK